MAWWHGKPEQSMKPGAKLDTMADMVFAAVCLIKILPVIALPTYLWILTALIAVIKIINIVSGFAVQQRFVAVHSSLNKLTGLLLFLLPITLAVVDIKYSGSVICAIAALAAIQEGYRIRVKSKGKPTMNLKNTKLFFLEEDCARQFGTEDGKAVYALTAKHYEKLCVHADFKGNDEIKSHLTTNLYPTMAYYRALLERGYDAEDALRFVRKETARAASIKKHEQAKITKIPCAYLMYRMFVKSVMKKKFPQEGWDTNWVRCDGKDIHFDMTRCIYKELCDAEGCPELCAVFCENDDIAFSGLMPKIRFERSGTLGKGSDRCDFHFIKNR